MFFDISDKKFKIIMKDEKLFLPKKWDGKDFSETLRKLYKHYVSLVKLKGLSGKVVDCVQLKKICDILVKTVKEYLAGFPAQAFETFKEVMRLLMAKPLKIYYKTVLEQFDLENFVKETKLDLFRAVKVPDVKPYNRERVFHTPYDMRSKIATNRYSIAGYPCLYLATSLQLCCEEIKMNPYVDNTIASRYEIDKLYKENYVSIRVIELGIKPQDFLIENNSDIVGEIISDEKVSGRIVKQELLKSANVRESYLLWYPLVAACSFIRVNKNDPFAAEYIIPQLVLQWVRSEMKQEENMLMGIRYFSCASEIASEMGFNYVFPTSGNIISLSKQYCRVLEKSFLLTQPKYVNDFSNINDCEKALKADKELKKIFSNG